MNTQQPRFCRAHIVCLYREYDDSQLDILNAMIREGWEFPDAVARIADALRLTKDEVEQLERDYDECC